MYGEPPLLFPLRPGSMEPIGRVELWSPHVLRRVRCALTVGATLVVSELLAGTATVSRNFLTHSHRPGGSPCTLGAVCERVESRRNFAQAVMEKYSPGKTNQTHKRNHLTPLHIVTARRLRVLFRGARRARRCALFTIPRSRRGHLPHITAMRIGLDGKHGTEPRGEAHAKYVPR